jgi:WbqC-like protein family
MRIAVMQPTYLPWMGYFALIDQVDRFVLLDDVKFSHQSWQHRNRIRSRESFQWLTVPVLVKGRGEQRIDEVEINRTLPWQRKHLQSILQGYSRAPWISEHRSWLESAYLDPPTKLFDLNRSLIEKLAEELEISTPMCRSSELLVGGNRVERLIGICKSLGAAEYLSPIGSHDYIEEDNRFPDAGIALLYQRFEHPVYRQGTREFIPQLSVLDLLLNEGPGSRDLLRSGIRQPYLSDEVPAAGYES